MFYGYFREARGFLSLASCHLCRVLFQQIVHEVSLENFRLQQFSLFIQMRGEKLLYLSKLVE